MHARLRDAHPGLRDSRNTTLAMKRARADTALRLVPDLEVATEPAAVARDAVWLRVEPVELIARHRWIRLRYSASFFDDPVRPLIRFKTRSGATFVQAMNGPVLGSAEWLGRVPDGTVKVAISPGRGGTPIELSHRRREPAFAPRAAAPWRSARLEVGLLDGALPSPQFAAGSLAGAEVCLTPDSSAGLRRVARSDWFVRSIPTVSIACMPTGT